MTPNEKRKSFAISAAAISITASLLTGCAASTAADINQKETIAPQSALSETVGDWHLSKKALTHSKSNLSCNMETPLLSLVSTNARTPVKTPGDHISCRYKSKDGKYTANVIVVRDQGEDLKAELGRNLANAREKRDTQPVAPIRIVNAFPGQKPYTEAIEVTLSSGEKIIAAYWTQRMKTGWVYKMVMTYPSTHQGMKQAELAGAYIWTTNSPKVPPATP